MKKIFSFVMVALLLMTGCVKDNLSLNGNGEKVAVTFTAELPIEDTRALVGDGSKADVVKYAIYSPDGTLFDGYNYQDLQVNGKVATLKLELVKGQSYKIAFWAQNSKAPYTFDRVAKTVVADYSQKDLSNDEIYDAFYALFPITVEGPVLKQVTLFRPFAQINLGATKADVAAAKALGVEIEQSSVTLTDVHTTLNLVDGTLGSDVVDVEFEWNALPGNDLEVNKVYYAYLAANYIFADSETDVTNLSFSVKQGQTVINTVNVPSVNYKRNYRTNILGRLLTSSVDFNIVIDGTPEGDIGQTWDGASVAEPGIDANGNYVISNAEQLAWLAAAVNGTLPATAQQNSTRAEEVNALTFENKTVVLASDIALNGQEWAPIGNTLANAFRGSFDGQGHTISNFKVTQLSSGPAGLFGYVRASGDFKNVTIDDVTVLCPITSGETNFYGAAFAGQLYGEHEFYNIVVKNSHIQGNGKTAGLIGNNSDCAQVVRDCHVMNCVIESTNPEDGGNIGGLVGFFQSTGGGGQSREFIIENSTVSGTTINAYNAFNNGMRANGKFIGCWLGAEGWSLSINNCSVDATTTLNQTVNGTDPVTYVSPYGEMLGGHRTETLAGKVFIDGVQVVPVTTPEALATLLSGAVEDVVLTLVEGVDYGTVVLGELKNVVINGSENSLVTFNMTADTKIENVTLKNINFEYTDVAHFGVELNSSAQIDNLVIEGCSFDGNGHKACHGLANCNRMATIVVKGCDFMNMGYPIWGFGGFKSLVVEDCNFSDIQSWAIMPQSGFDDLTITGCDFTNCIGGLVKSGSITAGHTFTFANNTITDCKGHDNKDSKWFEVDASAGSSVVTGNKKDGIDWSPNAANGLVL